MKLTYYYGNDHWCRVHRAGCKDAPTEARKDGTNDSAPYPTEAASRREVIEEVASDFIFSNDEQPWTDYIGQVSFAPCVDLPLELENQ